MSTAVDPKAKAILLSYDVLSPNSISKEDFEYAKRAGLMFELISQSHEEALAIAIHEKEKITKLQATSSFLASLSNNRMDWRAGLSAYALMQSFPEHKFEPYSIENKSVCAVCCSAYTENINRNFFNYGRFSTGGLVLYYIYEISFYLQEQAAIQTCKPVEEDFVLFSQIMDLLIQAAANDTPSAIQKQMRQLKKFKSTSEQRQVLLTTLGYCGILETQEHKGFLHQFTNICQAPRKSRNTDWSYPIDWWKGKDGINKKAFEYWFGLYPELEKYWKS